MRRRSAQRQALRRGEGRGRNTNKYEIVLTVYETGSIARAAERLHYTPSAVSQAVGSYERELGVELFRRSKRGMEPLPDTEELFAALKAIGEAEQRIGQIAANLTSLNTGHIRIGTIQSISYHWLPDLLRGFSRQYPNIRFDLTVDGFSGLTAALRAEKLDCAFLSRYAAPELPFIPLTRDELMLVTPLDHPLAARETLSVLDVDGEDFILSSDRLDYETGQVFQLNNITPRIRYRLNEDFAALNMVEKGFGVTILPKLLVVGAPFRVAVRPFTERYARVLGVAYSQETPPSLATLKFLDYVKSREGFAEDNGV